MSAPTVERAGDWDSVPFSGGYAGLRELADDEFSGMVTAGPARLFMLRGSVVGVLDGELGEFEDAGGTARKAPHPALPLLALMQERSDDVRAEYYTEDTPISEVDRTLADGNFTGYIELSENVLSGDYYQVYHQGHSMSVAYVGASERLIEDDEAFDQADDEVGIYEVRPVDVEVIEIPEPEPDDAGAEAAASTGAVAAVDDSEAGDAPDDAATESGDDAATDDGPAVDGEATVDDATTDDTTVEDPAQGVADDQAPGAADATQGSTDGSSTPTTDQGTDTAAAQSTEPGSQRSTGTATQQSTERAGQQSDASASAAAANEATDESGAGSTTSDADAGEPGHSEANAGARQGTPAPDHPAAGGRAREGPGSTDTGGEGAAGPLGAGDLEMRSLPSLDPDRTASASRQERERRSSSTSGAATAGASAAAGADAAAGSDESSTSDASRAEPPADRPSERPTGDHHERQAAGDGREGETGVSGSGEPAGEGGDTATGSPAEASAGASTDDAAAGDATIDDGAAESTGTTAGDDLEEARAEVDRLESELADLRDDHEDVTAERDRLEDELAEAREEIDRLHERLEDATDQASAANRTLSPGEAVDETNLFIRYDSKGEATLEKAHAGEVDTTAVDENLRLEYHTSFDAADAAVDGVAFDQFLTDTVQYRFVDWLVRHLLYEIRDTGNTGAMADLYDALPKVDRAELNGQVGVQYTEDGQDVRSQVGFDVIVRDRMGNPLVVANLNDSRDPATESMMTDLVRAAERVGESSPSLAGAFLVTRSFFEPEALETAEEATAGGLLNRGKQKSFVNLSRKGGYHLCLVEARNQEFHLAVPEL